jgi:ribonuclease P/MRP protein subunit RPP40
LKRLSIKFPSLLLVKLEHNEIRDSLLKWISAFLRNRKFYVKIGSASSAMQDVVSGVPQGSVLGPLMFLVYISDLTVQLRSRHALVADDYADDLRYRCQS